MPSYPFVDEATGKVRRDFVFAMKDAPSIGATVEIEGRKWTRVASECQIDPAHNRNQYPYVSQVLPRRLKGCETNRTGQPIVRSKRHERNIMAEHGYEKD